MAAQSLDDAEFWLPPRFLADDDGFVAKNTGFGSCKGESADASFPFELSHGFGTFGGVASYLSSPVESVVCSSETESEEEDYIAGLTLQMAHSALDDGSVSKASTDKFVLGSPQSPLCKVNSGCSRDKGSGGRIPNYHSPVSLPPTTLDLLFAAAEVARRRMNDGYILNRSRGLLVPPRKPSNDSVPMKDSNTSSENYHQLQALQFHHLQHQQQMLKQQNFGLWGNKKKTADQDQRHQYQSQMAQRNGWNSESGGVRNCHPLGLSPSAWPPLQESKNPKHGSGMRAVFLENPGEKRECAGTGVFLPRQIGNHSVTRKKPGCSPVLVPAKVIQALNLNLDEMQVQTQFQPHFSPQFVADCDAAQRFRMNSGRSLQKRNLHVQPMVNHELRLPNEWTY